MGLPKKNSAMKVLYLAHSESLQGAGIALINIVRGMVAQGVECIVVVPFHGEMENRLMEIGAKCYISRCYNAIYPRLKKWSDYVLWPYRLMRTIVFNAIAENFVSRLVDIERPDVIHTNSGVIRFGANVARKKNIPHVWHIREFQDRDFFGMALGGEKKINELYHSNHNHCVAITQKVFEHFSLTTPKDTVIYDGVFSESISIPVAQKHKYFLFVGALLEGKGILDLVESFNTISNRIPEYELWIAGKDYVNILGVIDKCVNPERIKYLGFRNDIYELMRSATAVVVPSYYEGFGFITVEAMLNNTLVIGRDTAGTKEQFDNGLAYTGKEIGIRFTSSNELQKAMCSVATDTTKYNEMISSAKKTVLAKYSLERNVEDLLGLYKCVSHAE